MLVILRLSGAIGYTTSSLILPSTHSSLFLFLLHLPPCHAARHLDTYFIAAEGLVPAADFHPMVAFPALAVS